MILFLIRGVKTSTKIKPPFSHSALKAGVPVPTPCLTVNRLCGSGFEAVNQIAQEIELGMSSIGIGGGAESMSQAGVGKGTVIPNTAFAVSLTVFAINFGK